MSTDSKSSLNNLIIVNTIQHVLPVYLCIVSFKIPIDLKFVAQENEGKATFGK